MDFCDVWNGDYEASIVIYSCPLSVPQSLLGRKYPGELRPTVIVRYDREANAQSTEDGASDGTLHAPIPSSILENDSNLCFRRFPKILIRSLPQQNFGEGV